MRREMWSDRQNDLAMYAVLLMLVGLFFLSYFNRFAGVRSGAGEYTAGVAFLAGRMPYRDYFTTAPPLNLLKSALLLKVFGESLIVSRAAGVAERLLIAAVLFRSLRQIFRRVPSLVASVATLVVSAGDRTDPIASYNHDAILFAMLSGLAANFVLSGERGGWRWVLLGMLSGCCGALSILTKQTVGVASACTVFAVTAVLLVRTEGMRRAARWMVAFGVGCAMPLAAVTVALVRMELLGAFLQMLLVKGPAAKAAHVSDFLVRELRVGWDNFGWLMLGTFALLLGWRTIWRSVGWGCSSETVVDQRDDATGAEVELRGAAYVLAAGLGVLGLAEMLRRWPALHDFSKASVYFTLLALTALLAAYSVRVAGCKSTPRQAQCVLLCAVSWSVAVSLSLSWPAFEAMVLPGLGLLVAAVLEGARRRTLPFVYAAVGLAVLMQMREKLDLPFGFDYQDEAALRWADAISDQPQMRGLRLPRETVRFLDETVATIQRNTGAEDRIFVYPEMGLLYALSSRTYPTVSGSHNIDVLNDSFAGDEAERLRLARPAVIVYYRETEQQQRDAERLWRSGRPSGQRLMVRAIEEMVRGYRLSGSYRLTEGDPEILVYVRQ